MNFSWYCFNAMEKPQKWLLEKYEHIPNYKVAVLNSKAYDANIVKQGGCYGNGTYLFNTTGNIFTPILIAH